MKSAKVALKTAKVAIRKPGAGRKPKGEFSGKSSVFTTRIRPDTREALERAAYKNRRSLSQEVELRLDQSFTLPAVVAKRFKRFGPDHISAFSRLVSMIGTGIEATTGLKWREDKFTHAAFKKAIAILFDQLSPDGDAVTPAWCEASAKTSDRYRPGSGEQMRHPEGVATAIALGLWTQLEIIEPPPINSEPNQHYSDLYFVLPDVRNALGIKLAKDKP